MNQTLLKKFLPHIGALLFMLILCVIFFKPAVFDNKVMSQGDNVQAKGMATEMTKYYEQTGQATLWTNSAFSGMPTYQIWSATKNLMRYPQSLFMLGTDMSTPHTTIFMIMFCMYLFLIVLKVDWKIALIGAIGYGFATNYMALVEAGHSTKLLAMAFVPAVFSGVLLIYQKKYLLGAGMTAFFMGIHLFSNHVQVTYYMFICMFIMGVFFFIDALKNKTTGEFFKASGIAVAMLVLGLMTNTSRFLTTYEYAPETIRGKSELVKDDGTVKGKGGLSKDYAFSWSYGKLETFNFLIPNFMGWGSSEAFINDKKSHSIKAIRQVAKSNEELQQLARATSKYWGTQPFTAVPIYMGAILIFLFFFGIFSVEGRHKYWMLTVVFLTLILGWGRNFPGFNNFVFDHFPLYNKFRAVTMILMFTNLFVVILGIMGLQSLLDKSVDSKTKKKNLFIGFGLTLGVLGIGYILAMNSGFGVDSSIPAKLGDAIALDRADMLKSDAIRSFLLILIGFGVIFFYLQEKIKMTPLIIALGVLTLFDMWTVGKRQITDNKFLSKRTETQRIDPQPVDKQIMSDKDLSFRVADFRGNPFANAITSYHHKSIGGYHAAKLMRYQELIEKYLGNPSKNSHIYGMLNTKYFIGNTGKAQINRDALGNAWFVKSVKTVENGNEEIDALASLKPKDEAVVQKRYANGLNFQYDSTATISLSKYHPDNMEYDYSAKTDQMAVFSEIYYPPAKGWKLYLDGQPFRDFTKVDYLLRGVVLPAGKHHLEMKFHPNSYYIGEKFVVGSSLLIILFFVWTLFQYFKKEFA